MTTTKIGWIGLGKMGVPMSQQLIKAGYPLTVYNRSKEKEAMFKSQGIAAAESPKMLIEQTDLIIIMVADDTAIREIFTAENGLLAAKTSGKIIVNMSTVSAEVSTKMAALCAAQNNHYLDAPVSGSVKQAEEGQLVIMAGGDEKAFQSAKPVLEKLGKLAMLIGAVGAGNTAKLAINSLLAIYAQGLAETVLFAKKNNVKPEDLMTLIGNSAIGNTFTKIKGDAIIQNNYTPAFALKHIVKDLRLAKDKGLNTRLSSVVLKTFEEASGKFGDEDIIAVIKAGE